MSYEYYKEKDITKSILDSVKVDDLIKINDWNVPYRVKAVSDNYFLMTRKAFGNEYYSICEKIKWSGVKYNSMRGVYFHVGTDHWVFGSPITLDFDDCSFDNQEYADKYIKTFEIDGINKNKLSARSAILIHEIYIKRSDEQ